MAEHETIEQAVDAQARGRLKKASELDRQLEYLAIDELIKADRYQKGKLAARKPNLGLRMTRLIPPAGG